MFEANELAQAAKEKSVTPFRTVMFLLLAVISWS